MQQDISLSYYTCAPISPLEQIELAKNIGYCGVGLRPVQPRPDAPVQSILGDKALIRAIARASRDLGVRIFDLEFVWLDAALEPERCKPLMELGANLGATAVLVGGMDPEWNRMPENYASLCALAADAGLLVDLEFMPWTCVASLADAVRLIDEAGSPANGRLLIDTIHFFRRNTPVQAIAELKPGLLHSVQLCDDIVRADLAMSEARSVANAHRLAPGSGSFHVQSFIAALPVGTHIALEVPNQELRERHGAAQWARMCFEAAQTLFAATP